MILSEQIRRGRKQLGMSQADLADAIWVSRNTISNWESGATTPDIQRLVLMSALFGVTLDQMVKDDDQVMAQAFARDKNHMLLASSVIDASGTNESETDGSNEEDLSLFGLRSLGNPLYGKFENADITDTCGLRYRLPRRDPHRRRGRGR